MMIEETAAILWLCLIAAALALEICFVEYIIGVIFF